MGIKERDSDLDKEALRQEQNDKLRKEFAQHANAFYQWLTETRASMMEGSGTLEQQLEATKRKASEVRARRQDLKKIEDLGAILEEHLILDNRYTEHSTVGLAQQWDQLDQLGMRMQHNLEQQIQARNQSGVSEDALKEFSMMFRHFDKETENVATSDGIVNAFQAITTQEREYITKKELYAHLAKEMADYCLHKMTPYVDPRTQEPVPEAYDYMEFT